MKVAPGIYFGRSWKESSKKEGRPLNKGFPLRQGGMPMPWCDEYADRLVAVGFTVEKRELIATWTWEVVDVVAP